MLWQQIVELSQEYTSLLNGIGNDWLGGPPMDTIVLVFGWFVLIAALLMVGQTTVWHVLNQLRKLPVDKQDE